MSCRYNSFYFSDVEESQADFSEVFPDCEAEEEKSGDFYQTPASPITVPYCRPASQGIVSNILIVIVM